MSHVHPQQPEGRVRHQLLELIVCPVALLPQLLGGMDVNLVTILAVLAVAVSQTSQSKYNCTVSASVLQTP